MKVKELLTYGQEDLEGVVLLSKMMDETIAPLFEIKPFKHLLYKEVLLLKDMVQQSDMVDDKLIIEVAKLNDHKLKTPVILNSQLKNYFKTVNIIEDNFKEIASYEKLLQTHTDGKLESAGIDKLNQFGDLNTIDALANGDILKWESVLDLVWWDCFNYLYINKVRNDIRKNLELQRELDSKK